MSSEMETRSREGGALATALAAEQALQAEESMLLQRAADLEKQVREHKLRKEAAALAKQQAEEQRKAEEELEKWAQELKAEVDKTIERLNAQRATQIARCQQFDATLQANIEAMQQMQMQVRRRQAALDAAFDAAAAKVANAHHDAVLTRRRQAAAEATQRAMRQERQQRCHRRRRCHPCLGRLRSARCRPEPQLSRMSCSRASTSAICRRGPPPPLRHRRKGRSRQSTRCHRRPGRDEILR